MASGTKDDPWVLKTPPGTSDYTMYRDDEADPALIVCQVGSTKLTYQARAIEDLAAWLRKPGRLGIARFRRRGQGPRSRDSRGVRAFGPRTLWAAGTACGRATAAASACICHHCSKSLVWPK